MRLVISLVGELKINSNGVITPILRRAYKEAEVEHRGDSVVSTDPVLLVRDSVSETERYGCAVNWLDLKTGYYSGSQIGRPITAARISTMSYSKYYLAKKQPFWPENGGALLLLKGFNYLAT